MWKHLVVEESEKDLLHLGAGISSVVSLEY